MAEEKKIIIDEDWKSQVEAEKEQAARASSQQEGDQSPGEAAAGDEAAMQWPPASFPMLVSTFATEAMVGLGQIPSPLTNEPEVSPPRAKYAIDMLAVLQEKTKGNLDPGEDAGLEDLLHQLRMAYVAVTQGGKA